MREHLGQLIQNKQNKTFVANIYGTSTGIAASIAKILVLTEANHVRLQ